MGPARSGEQDQSRPLHSGFCERADQGKCGGARVQEVALLVCFLHMAPGVYRQEMEGVAGVAERTVNMAEPQRDTVSREEIEVKRLGSSIQLPQVGNTMYGYCFV